MIAHRHLAQLFYAPFKNVIWKYPSHQNQIYLTFDDGPYPPVTRPLLEALSDYRIPATFFLSGENIVRYRKTARELDYSGHQLGNHLFHHLPLWELPLGKRSKRKLLKEIDFTDRLIFNHFNQLPKLLRPPYGIFNPTALSILDSTAKQMVLWSLMAYDFKWDEQKILRHLIRHCTAGDIVVFHDSPKTEPVLMKVLPRFVEHCRAKGWSFSLIRLETFGKNKPTRRDIAEE